MEVAGVSQPGELATGTRWLMRSSRETHLGGAESGTLGRDRGMGAEEDFLGGEDFKNWGKFACLLPGAFFGGGLEPPWPMGGRRRRRNRGGKTERSHPGRRRGLASGGGAVGAGGGGRHRGGSGLGTA